MSHAAHIFTPIRPTQSTLIRPPDHHHANSLDLSTCLDGSKFWKVPFRCCSVEDGLGDFSRNSVREPPLYSAMRCGCSCWIRASCSLGEDTRGGSVAARCIVRCLGEVGRAVRTGEECAEEGAGAKLGMLQLRLGEAGDRGGSSSAAVGVGVEGRGGVIIAGLVGQGGRSWSGDSTSATTDRSKVLFWKEIIGEGEIDSTSVSSVTSLSAFLRYCAVLLLRLNMTVSPPDTCESVGLCGGVSVSWMFSRSPTETLLVSAKRESISLWSESEERSCRVEWSDLLTILLHRCHGATNFYFSPRDWKKKVLGNQTIFTSVSRDHGACRAKRVFVSLAVV